MGTRELLGPEDPRATDFSGKITLSGIQEQTSGEWLGVEMQTESLIASPKGIGYAIAVLMRGYVEGLPEHVRAVAAMQIFLALQEAHTAMMVDANNKRGQH